jgi:hypothetical protein
MQQERAYRYRCYLTPDQDAILSRTFDCTRFVDHWGLKLRTDAWSERRERVNYEATSAALTALKQDKATEWLNEVSSVPLQHALRNFFEGRAQYPVFKKHWNRQAATYAMSAFTRDGTFGEDASRLRKGGAAEHLAVVRPFALNLLRKDPAQRSLKGHRRKAALDTDFLLRLLLQLSMRCP